MPGRLKALFSWTLLSGFLALVATWLFVGAPALARASEVVAGGGGTTPDAGWGYLGAALATGFSSLGAGYAVAHVGSSAIGAITEKPELLGRMLILVGLAEGIAIYGLIISILILNRLG
ncbi:MAG: ATP synthase subunit C [Magnetococcus sp. DMHC-6]